MDRYAQTVRSANTKKEEILCFLDERGEDKLIIAPADARDWNKEQLA
jgi:hypothetical protein